MTMADSLTVLVVEDDENLSEIIAETLRVAGYEVRTAHDGLHGISSCMDCRPDVVLTDIQMPGLNGIEMMRCIRAINPGVKAIYISGAVDQYCDVLAREDKEHGAIVLNKPFSRYQLFELLTEWRRSGIENPFSAPSCMVSDDLPNSSPAPCGQSVRSVL